MNIKDGFNKKTEYTMTHFLNVKLVNVSALVSFIVSLVLWL